MAIKWGKNGDKMARKWRQMEQNGDKWNKMATK